MANEIKEAIFGSQASPAASGNVEASAYDLTFDAQTTTSLNYNDSYATIQAGAGSTGSASPGVMSA